MYYVIYIYPFFNDKFAVNIFMVESKCREMGY